MASASSLLPNCPAVQTPDFTTSECFHVNRTNTAYFQNDLNFVKMTVPAAGVGVLGPRKPLYRCIPEIHVTRLSASSSLRPKLGLLLLFVVLLVTLCLAGVPLVTKVLVPLVHSRSHKLALPAPILNFEQTLLDASNGIASPPKSSLISPALVLASLQLLTKWSSSHTKQELVRAINSSKIHDTQAKMSGLELDQVFLVPGQQAKAEIVSKDSDLELLDFRVREARHQVGDWWKRHGVPIDEKFLEGKLDNSQLVGLAFARVTVSLGTPMVGSFHGVDGEVGGVQMLRVEGDFLRLVKAESTTIVMEGVGEGLDLCLVLPNAPSLATQLPTTEHCSSPELKKSNLAIVLPRLAIKSRVALKESLSKSNLKSVFSETADLSLMSKQQGLRLGELLQVVSFNLEAGTEIQKKEQKEAEELIFNRPFTFLVRQTPSNSTIVIGHIWGQNEK